MRDALMEAVQAKYAADGSLPTLGGTLYLERAPDELGPTTKYTVLTIREDTEFDTLGNDGARIRFVFNVYTPRSEGIAAQKAAVRRLKAVFHGLKLTSVTGYAFTVAGRVSGINVPEPDTYWHMAEEYEVYVFAA